MTRTEERLADALGAAARTVREGTLDPLIVPERPLRRRPAWAAPVAAAAGLLLAVGLGAAVSGHIPGTGNTPASAEAAGPPPRYYVASQLGGTGSTLVVRATATGAVTDSLQIQSLTVPDQPVADFGVITAAANGEFFIAAGNITASPAGSGTSQQLYRFRLTDTGRITGLSPVPDGAVGGPIDTMAASPDGSELAIAADSLLPGRSPHILVINTATGARSVWQGGMARRSEQFGIASLSWTGNGRELVFLGQWFRASTEFGRLGSRLFAVGVDEGSTPSDAQAWALDPTSGGGALDAGQMLLRQSGQYPDIEQAAISADGTALTAVVGSRLAGAGTKSGDLPTGPAARPFSVDQISVATGTLLDTLYQGTLDVAVTQFSSDGLGGHWLILGANDVIPPKTFSGWIRDGQLTALPGTAQNTSLQGIAQDTFSEAWSASFASQAPSRVARQSTTAGTPPRYYVETNSDGQVVVRSTATGTVTATVGIPASWGPLVTAAGNGRFFVARGVPRSATLPANIDPSRWPGPALYKFRLTGAGQVSGLSEVPGGAIGTGHEQADAIAAAPNGSQVAVAIGPEMPTCSGVPCPSPEGNKGADHIVVINVATGAGSLWQGGMPNSLYIPSLSWTANGRELVFLGQTCQAGLSRSQAQIGCLPANGLDQESSEVWALDPAPGGGKLSSARLLLGQPAAYQDLAQAVISPDGSTITAAALSVPASQSKQGRPLTVSVVQISVATGKQLSVLFSRVVGETQPTPSPASPFPWPRYGSGPDLSTDATGQYVLLDVPCPKGDCPSQPHGWINGGKLTILPPTSASLVSEAW